MTVASGLPVGGKIVQLAIPLHVPGVVDTMTSSGHSNTNASALMYPMFDSKRIIIRNETTRFFFVLILKFFMDKVFCYFEWIFFRIDANTNWTFDILEIREDEKNNLPV